ncbi:MAG: MFS transporter [Sulfurospirillum sp.]|nr:MFS transporter [Sulfurospirillum sp.]
MKKKKSTLGGSRAWVIWFIANLIVVFGFNLQTGYAFVNNSMGIELNLTLAQIAFAGSVYTWVFAISQFFSGSILDVFSVRKIFPLSVLLVLIGAYLFANASSLQSLVFAQIFLALGASFGFVGAGFIGGLWFGFSKFGIMFGLTQTFVSLGSFVGGVIFSNLIENGASWSEVLDYMVYFGIVVLILTLLFIEDPINSKDREHKKINKKFFIDILKSIVKVAKKRSIIVSACSGGITFGVFLAMAVLWAPKLIMAHGFSEIDAGMLTSWLWVGLATGALFVNTISNKLKSRRFTMMLFGFIQAISLTIIIYINTESTILMGAIMFLFAVSSSGHMLAFTVGGEVVKLKFIATSSAVINGTMYLFGGFVIWFLGEFLHGNTLNHFQDALISMPILLVIASLMVYLMKESFTKSR